MVNSERHADMVRGEQRRQLRRQALGRRSSRGRVVGRFMARLGDGLVSAGARLERRYSKKTASPLPVLKVAKQSQKH
jgi:hypothetical protein